MHKHSHMASSQAVIEACSKRLVEVRERNRDFAPNRLINHICSQADCAPINETLCYQRRLLAPPFIAPYVFLCRYGVVHVCTRSTCTRYMETPQGVCPISGISYGGVFQTDYDKEDSRTWYQKPQLQHKANSSEQVARITRKKRSRTSLMMSIDLFQEHKEEEQEEEEEQEDAPREEKPPHKEGEEPQKVIPAKKKANKRVRSEDSAKARIRLIIETLLFSSIRNEFNEAAIRDNEVHLQRERERYLAKCRQRHEFPNVIDMHVIANYYANKPLPLLDITMDRVMLQYYISVVHQIWQKASTYMDDTHCSIKLSLDAVALGALYALREGLSAHGLEIIPRDKVLSKRGVLPLINDITHFGFAKKKVTTGSKLIIATYDAALRLNVSRENLLIDFSSIEEQNAEPVQMFAVGKERPRAEK